MARLVNFILVSVFVVALTEAGDKFADCGSKKGKIDEVIISACPDSYPKQGCILERGTNVVFNVTFEPNEDADKVTAVVYGIIGGFPVPFPLDNPNACKDSGLTCPIKAGQKVTYSSVLPIKSAYPSIKCVVKWELRDAQNNNIFCMEVPVQITGRGARKQDTRINHMNGWNSKKYNRPN